LQRAAGYWLVVIVGGLLAGSLVDWLVNLQGNAAGTTTSLAGTIVAATIVLLGLIGWIVAASKRLRRAQGIQSWSEVLSVETVTGFVPFVIWWFLLTVVAYTIAGEKMPWLSTHFVIPMVILGGWYLNDRFAGVSVRDILSRSSLLLHGVSLALIVALALAVGPLLLGRIEFGGQEQSNLAALGRVLGHLVVVGGLLTLWRRLRRESASIGAGRVWLASGLLVLAVITARFTYLANFPNGDYANEFLVYAHGAPSTKDTVMDQVDTLSLRLHGDRSLKVAYDNISSWPYTWYLRDYPNRLYFGETPGRNIADYPVIIVGDNNYSKVEPLVQDDYEVSTHTFIWWPMEEYRRISWSAIVGDPNVPAEERRGLGRAGVRQALWDIFWYRDYTRYGEVFGGRYAASEWPLRRPLRLYIRKDVYAQLWDYGAAAIAYEPPVDPYAEGAFDAIATGIIGADELLMPRNLDVAPDGRIVVADSGNHRIVVFSPEGELLTTWGGFGSEPGLFNEPWGIAVDRQHVYVADTWNHRVQKFTYEGELVDIFGQAGTPAEGDPGAGLFFGPRSIVLLGDDRILVTDTGNHRLQMFDQDGNFIRQVGGQGALLGQLYEPVGLAVEPDGDILLADTWNSRVQRFTAELLPIGEWSVEAWEGESINNKPYLVVDSENRAYVTDPEGYRVLIFDEGGQYVGRFGRYGTDDSGFGLPNGIAVDAEDNIYVADAGNNRILKFAASELRR
jgi:sugar lactone lactonase YvrE